MQTFQIPGGMEYLPKMSVIFLSLFYPSEALQSGLPKSVFTRRMGRWEKNSD
jgi:hypothetical protein